MGAVEGEAEVGGGAVAPFGDEEIGLVLGAGAVGIGVYAGLPVAVQEHYYIGILLYGATLAEVGQAGAFVGAAFALAVELRKEHDGYVEVHSQHFEGAADGGHLLLAVAVFEVRFYKLQVVYKQYAEAVLFVQPAGLCLYIVYGKAGGLREVYGQGAELLYRLQHGLLLRGVGEAATVYLPMGYAAVQGGHAGGYAYVLHLERDEPDGVALLCQVQGHKAHKGALAYGGARAYYHKIARAQAAVELIEHGDAGGQAGHIGKGGLVYMLHQVVAYLLHGAPVAGIFYVKNTFECCFGSGGGFEGVELRIGHGVAELEHFAACIFFAQYISPVGKVCGIDHAEGKGGEVVGGALPIYLHNALARELVGNGLRIYLAAGLVHGGYGHVYMPMAAMVEAEGMEDAEDIFISIGLQQQYAEHAGFGSGAVVEGFFVSH